MTVTLAHTDPATWIIRGRLLAYLAQDLLEPWPSQQVRTMRALFDAGLSYGLMARRLGRTRNAVMSKVYRLKWRREGTTKQVRRTDARPPRPPRKAVVLKASKAPPKGLLLLDLPKGSCHYPTGETAAGWLFCGSPRQDQSSYCAHHHKRCHKPRVSP